MTNVGSSLYKTTSAKMVTPIFIKVMFKLKLTTSSQKPFKIIKLKNSTKVGTAVAFMILNTEEKIQCHFKIEN